MAVRDRIRDLRRVRAGDLVPHPGNWRVHPRGQQDALRGVLKEVGYADALLARELPDGRLGLIDGHLRRDLDPEQIVPVLVLDVDEHEAKKLLLTLDPLAAMATANAEALDALLKSVETESEAVAKMLEELAAGAGIVPPEAEPVDAEPQINRAKELQVQWETAAGQLWEIPSKTVPGKCHRVLCGDSTREADVGRLMGGKSPDACISDPPYGIGFDTDYTRFSAPKTTQFVGANKRYQRIHGDDRPFDPTPFLAFKAVVLFGANYFAKDLPFGTWLVWDKRFANGKAWLSDAEIAWMKGGTGVYVFSLTCQGMVRPEPAQHPTQKPVALMMWCIEKSKAGNLVYDPFLGSFTTIVACENLARIGYGLEIDPGYMAVGLERLKQIGLTPRLAPASAPAAAGGEK